MTTNTRNTDQQVAQSETLEQIAERIAKKITDNPCAHPSCCPRTAGVKADILSALRNERERCAQVADTIQQNSRTMTAKNTAMTIALIIREGR